MTDIKGTASFLEPVELINMLIKLQDEIIYIIECLLDDYTGEARSSIGQTERLIKEMSLPDYIAEPVLEQLVNAYGVLCGHHDISQCSRYIQQLRRRIANELAWRLGVECPYPISYSPLFSAHKEQNKQTKQ